MITIDLPPLSNTLGFVSLICYVLSLLPTILRVVFPKTKKNRIPKFLLKHRRTIGILAFIFALGHGYILVKKRDVDFFDLKTLWIYIQGVITFGIFTLLTITSNDWSVKKLKKNWKRLHQLTYLAMFLLTWHIWDKMSGHWTYITPVGVIMITGITILFLVRRWKEWQVE
ncbi:ferric reductase-like transmembrane domain-containing protein [Laspinema olomoucense]|uniref:Ferric reductase-like transmembrane domain-containing protein n=1 Tax=Laspinema olomoucense D3b TaxID=2953688 RepID=A0ABT2NAS7_9CYAN|nr:ferric reductase-like transmembrane domain-containing protein [Laspinema sp. D3b]MCT7979808.1 ferric reductase-like transmembrane domain-containing protein [Laspinema sp. D3b]